MKKNLLGIFLLVFICGFANAQTYMYGTTSDGGVNNLGTIYRVDENGQNFQKLFDFTSATGGNPFGGLTLANNKLYGFTTTGGQIVNAGAVLASGTFYEFDPLTNNLNVIEFIDDKSLIGSEFSHSPTLSSNGKLYFVSSLNGLTSLDGVLSSFDPVSSAIVVLDTLTSFYGQPKSKLLEASDGNLYITTNNGAGFGFGAVVQYEITSGTLNRLHSSIGGFNSNDQYDNALNNTLFEASNGVLYGCSQGGGTGTGIVFKINKDGTGYQTLFEMSAGISNEGYYPEGGFIEINGVLYSSTPQEDIVNVNSGTLFTLDISSNIVSFIYILDLEGAQPKGVFTESSNGRFYLTCSGGQINNGSIIEFNPLNSNVTQRHLFGLNDGIKPQYDELAVVDFSVLSINENYLLDNIVKTYPNPVQDVVNIKVEKSHLIETIKILDMSGSELFIDNSSSIEYNVNTSLLSSGVYLLYIQTDLGSTTRKIIKE